MNQTIKKIILGPVDWFTYSVLNERQRKKIGDLFSDEQKQLIQKIVGGKKQAERQKLKQINYDLYNLGFHYQAQKDLEQFYEEADDVGLRRLAAWELILWHANQNTEAGAKEALRYFNAAREGVTDEQQLRRIAILEAECYEKTDQRGKAQAVIDTCLKEQKHADLYLARANLTESIDERFRLVNEVMEAYELAPISFKTSDKAPIYDDLQTEKISKEADGPKVSVILPAYQAEFGIRVAIESILNQTWQNIELLAVDDCSPDNTYQVIQEYAEKDPRVKVLQTPENSGPYVARNIALEQATGEFITINDADDWSHAEKIETQVRHLIEHPEVIANTSEHARLTEELTFYRRGTPGKYIFPNMSSIMFRREPVLERIGYWDSVRFAADGEFKRRLLKAFGKSSYVDLHSGPLSLPRQSVTSLTASSAFGYNGFFMGVRREYVEAFSHHHETAETIRYPFPMETRSFPVPEPMWPRREEKEDGMRKFDLILATDFRNLTEENESIILQEIKKQPGRIGLMQIQEYGVPFDKPVSIAIRELLDGNNLQMVVYGEKIKADQVIILHPAILSNNQQYVAAIETNQLDVLIDELPEDKGTWEAYLTQIRHYFNQDGTWYPQTELIKNQAPEEITQYIPFERQVWK
jgi:glycosyltransferase involved in cell wall biosynthesis